MWSGVHSWNVFAYKIFTYMTNVELTQPSTDFFNLKHESLKQDYLDPDGIHSDICLLIACDIADLLIKEGKNPAIYEVKGELLKGSKINRQSLVPKQYGGRRKWGAHKVCVENNIVFDPILPKPIPISIYPEQAFEGNVHMTEEIPPEEIPELLSRRQ